MHLVFVYFTEKGNNSANIFLFDLHVGMCMHEAERLMIFNSLQTTINIDFISDTMLICL